MKVPPVVGSVVTTLVIAAALLVFGAMYHMAGNRKGCSTADNNKHWQGRLSNTGALIGVVSFSLLLAWRLYKFLPSMITDSAYGVLLVGFILSTLLLFMFAVIVQNTLHCGGKPKPGDGLYRVVWGMEVTMLSVACVLTLLFLLDTISIFYPGGGPYMSRFIAGAKGTLTNIQNTMKSIPTISFQNPLFAKK